MKRTLVALLSAGLLAGPAMMARAQTAISEREARAIAVDAYLYLYPLVTMDVTRKQSTNIESGKQVGKGAMNTFTSVREYPPPITRVLCE
jgi:hypothetical protein